ncbi:PRTRC system protein D [Azohydromonas aeria]|uniref:PRTRC system protein D n=1 Tax=Azohydromonas aeria TaxID=2590212 RepID=UPI0012F888A6|nr:PRTRC system protein D [Azohydromonas aeria]
MDITIRAIDLGFGNTKYVSAAREGQSECAHFRSLAFFSASEKSHDGLGGRRRTVCVPVDKLFYEVGPDVELAADRFRSRTLHDDYIHTSEYRALTAGALAYMKQETIDLLVVGLPVAQYLDKRAALEKLMTGRFAIGRGRHVTVLKTLVVAQPQGALFHFAADASRLRDLKSQRSLIIDVGTRTFDWLVTQGIRVVPRMSHSVNRGVFDVVRLIAGEISREIGEDYQNLEAIDEALSGRRSLRLYQKDHDLKRYEPLVQKIADEAVSSMLQQIDHLDDFDSIVLVGGGAALFRKAVKRRLPRHVIQDVDEPMYANVRGYQLIGEEWARANPQALADARQRHAQHLGKRPSTQVAAPAATVAPGEPATNVPSDLSSAPASSAATGANSACAPGQ